MLELGPLAFAQPWLLAAAAALPLLWWLLRLMPPAPKRLRFPALRLLTGLRPPEETPARTPPWLVALRLLILALIIVGLAQPLLNPSRPLAGQGPLLLIVDDGWAAARHWPTRRDTMDRLLEQVERDDRPMIVLTTAPKGAEGAVTASDLLNPVEARRLLQGLTPQPWPVDRRAALAALDGLDLEASSPVVWLSDGLNQGETEAELTEFMARLRAIGPVRVYQDEAPRLARRLQAPQLDSNSVAVTVERATTAGEDLAVVRALADDGRLLGRGEARFGPGETTAGVSFELPTELRNEIASLRIEAENSAAAVFLVDERWRRRPVGLVVSGPLAIRPLLGEVYYLERALAPYSEIHKGTVGALLQQGTAVLILADAGQLPPDEAEVLSAWVERGGTLLRFAGPRLAQQGSDETLPVRLRLGDRTLGGAMTWSRPARLAPFHDTSPFAGLELPADVVVERQVLAEPSLDLPEKTWARLEDGTPLVTADRRGDGWLVLVHTSANTDWSNLALSGLFVEMLRKIVAVSQGIAGSGGNEALPPLEALDGLGRLGTPPATAVALDAETIEAGRIDARHPPGLYGRDGLRRAHNLADRLSPLTPLGASIDGQAVQSYTTQGETDLLPWLLAGALFLAMIDMLIALALRGLLLPGRSGATAALLLAALFGGGLLAEPAAAQSSDDAFALQATTQTRIAFVQTGVPAVDEVSRAGLSGLSRVLNRRTAVEAAEPVPVRLGRDELAFFPLLYWPVVREQRALDSAALRDVNAFLKNGGTILFDLRRPEAAMQSLGRPSAELLALSRQIEIPALIPVPPDHVLTKAFYLMQDFPGRFTGATLWIESAEGRVNDGVASVIIGANDWAAAWATDAQGRPLFPAVPGGERQREMAYRFGVNLVMYALTGNYKTDQVHVPYILERLGQ